MENTEFVFVSLYIMLGDADGSIDGCRVLSRKDWDEDVEEFKKHLLEEKVEEAEVLNKFLGSSQGDFRLPTEFI